jgi:hypothetical protein
MSEYTGKLKVRGQEANGFWAIVDEAAADGDQAPVFYEEVQTKERAEELCKRWNCHKDLVEALKAAEEHLSYCGYGDSWERECAEDLPEQISAALAAAD